MIWLARHFFAIFKYFVYLALAADVGFFFVEEWLAAQHVFQDGLPARSSSAILLTLFNSNPELLKQRS
jgi:hypothetical protein